ncbi:unnamed protein product [marine sediment metagenome]|jgi:predicted RNase H-like HicB family nuclease|uniref:HicB-like antitoxin of toxin-antitoxin system domain-containing protein n=3 Tax=marine sediment metagenome TaxID=412755 RepID=X1NQS3_9ZZZZ
MRGYKMTKYFTLEYWKDNDWYVGRLKEVPGIFSQGKTEKELEKNIRDAYYLMIEDDKSIDTSSKTKQIRIKV